MKDIIGLDIGGTKTALVMARAGDTVEFAERVEFPTNVHLGLEQALRNIFEAIERLVQRHSARDFAIGVSCGGPLDSKRGIIQSPPNLIGWNDVPIVSLLKERFSCPAFLQNDANACALAEWRFGAGAGLTDMIFLTFGTGMGAGLILNGKLYEGASGMAGEIGHVRLSAFGPVGYGKAGSFEGYCSGGGVAQLARTYLLEQVQLGKEPELYKDNEPEAVNALVVFKAAANGDALAQKAVAECGRRLGEGLSILIDVLNPQAIVLGGIFARNREALSPHMRAVIGREALGAAAEACRILPAKLSGQIGDYGAVITALYGLEQESRQSAKLMK